MMTADKKAKPKSESKSTSTLKKSPEPKQRVSKPSDLISRIKALEGENAKLVREFKKLTAKVEKLQVDKALYKLRIRATEEENKRIRAHYGMKKCYYEGSDSE